MDFSTRDEQRFLPSDLLFEQNHTPSVDFDLFLDELLARRVARAPTADDRRQNIFVLGEKFVQPAHDFQQVDRRPAQRDAVGITLLVHYLRVPPGPFAIEFFWHRSQKSHPA